MALEKRRWANAILFLCAVLCAIVVFSDSSHHTNARYLIWRQFAVGDWRYGVRFLNVDSTFRTSFQGKSRAHLLRWFPDLRPGGSRAPVCPQDAEWKGRQDHAEWIGDTLWLVLYRGGAVSDIVMPKGC